MPTVNDLLEIAKAELANLLPGEVFLVRDLFKGYEWNRISRSDRYSLAPCFSIIFRTDDIGIAPIEKTSSGQQRYKA